MAIPLDYSIFKEVLFPHFPTREETSHETLSLRRSIRHQCHPNSILRDASIVVFDLETTGLDAKADRIIEIGAQKLVNLELVDEFSSLVSTRIPLTDEIQKLTGISPDMLKGQPLIDDIMPKFLKFIEGSILVAHNANFDFSFIKEECNRLGLDLDWPTMCTLKMAQELLEDLPRKNLDTLAEYYGLKFEARHRSIGDVKVTVGVLKELLENEASHLQTWRDMRAFHVS